jgi:hypothetical protein
MVVFTFPTLVVFVVLFGIWDSLGQRLSAGKLQGFPPPFIPNSVAARIVSDPYFYLPLIETNLAATYWGCLLSFIYLLLLPATYLPL